MNLPRPVFIFSLPRSGSTLLQRLLAAHPAIASASEPTFLLPLLFSLDEQGAYSRYQHELAAWAIQDFAASLPNGQADYLEEIRSLALRLYARSAKDETTYFVDKTPIYSLVVQQVIDLFPDGKFIFLWRNPLASVASIMRTFSQKRWAFHLFAVHYYEGLPNLVSAYLDDRTRAHALRYEDLVSAPEKNLSALMDYLELPYRPEVFQDLPDVQFEGRLGDPNARLADYSEVRQHARIWTEQFGNPLRRRWARRYISEIGAERLEVMGYQEQQLLDELTSQPPDGKMLVSDLYRMIYGRLYPWFEFRMLRHKLVRARKRQKLFIHI